jgi:hypothetical protein
MSDPNIEVEVEVERHAVDESDEDGAAEDTDDGEP